MNILLVSSDNSISSGAFNSLAFVAKGLIKMGHDVLVVLPNDGDGEQLLLEYKIPFKIVPSEDWVVFGHMSQEEILAKKRRLLRNSTKAILAMHKIILDNHIDMVHINTIYHFVAALATKGTGAKIIWHIREFLEEAQGGRLINRQLGLSLIGESDAIAFVSKSLHNKYRNVFNAGRSNVIYNGIDVEKYKKAEHEILTDKVIRLLCVGGIVPSKGQLDVCEALGRCSKKLPKNVQLELGLVGACDATAREHIEKICQKYQIDNIRIYGRQADTIPYYKNADILCMSSVNEAFGRVTVEGMMAGCLVIGRNDAGTAELIEDRKTGLLYNNVGELAKQILWVARNKEAAKNIAIAGQAHAQKNYTADLNCKNIEKLYNKVLKQPQQADNTRSVNQWLTDLFKQDSQRVAAVVVTYNRKDLLSECVDTILHQTSQVANLFIIDNASTDGTKTALAKRGWLKNKKVHYVGLEKNMGGSGGFYEGIKIANQGNYDWVWVMDDDTIPELDCLEQLLSAQMKIPDRVSFLASTIRSADGVIMNTPGLDLALSQNGYLNLHEYLDAGALRITSATFVSLLINNAAIDAVGYPCKDYFIWGDDTEYTTRLTRSYGPAYLVGASQAIHKRKEARTLSILEENDIQRLWLYFYLYRNTLINQRAYCGKRAAMRRLRDDYKTMRRIMLTKSCRLKVKKIGIIVAAHRAYLFRKYDLRAFLNRYSKDAY